MRNSAKRGFCLTKFGPALARIHTPEVHPLFLGISYFEFQQAYWKGGSEEDFGMFGFGGKVLANMSYFGKDYKVHAFVCVWAIATLSLSADLGQAKQRVLHRLRVLRRSFAPPPLPRGA